MSESLRGGEIHRPKIFSEMKQFQEADADEMSLTTEHQPEDQRWGLHRLIHRTGFRN